MTAMTSKIAVICVASPTVGTYINAVAGAYANEQCERFLLLAVTSPSIGYTKAELEAFVRLLRGTLEDLSNGAYEGHVISYPSTRSVVYGPLARRINDHRVCRASEFSEIIGRLAAENNENLVIDISGLPKVEAIEVVYACIVLGIPVFAFELHQKLHRNDPERDLYHALSVGQYSYPCITERASVRALRERLVSRGTVQKGILGTLGVLAASLVAVSVLIGPDNWFILGIGLASSAVGLFALLPRSS